MNSGGRIIEDMRRLIALFSPHCADRTTMNELVEMLSDEDKWPNAHGLFQRIRAKTRAAERPQNSKLESQYLFEEVCAKTLYNLSHSSAPFDPDSPYWIVPNAFSLARELQIDDSQVLQIMAR